MSKLFRTCLLLLGFVIVGTAIGQEPKTRRTDVIRAGGIEFRFASAAQGRQLLGRRDSFVDQMSPFDRQVRMGTQRDAGTPAYLEFVAREVRDWPNQDRNAVRQAIEMLDQPLREIDFPEMGPVLLIHTTGREESGAAYTRGSAIVLPRGKTGSMKKPKHRLIAHELFHVLSRNNSELRDQLYRNIGFRYVGHIPPPADLAKRRLSNPDAPLVEHVIDLQVSERSSVAVCPLLFSESAFDPDQERTLFGYLKFQLMEVHSTGKNKWVPRIVAGKPVFHDPMMPDYHRQIGRNTRYIIHPEEILADNFASLVTGAAVKDPWVIDAMRKTLAGVH